MKKSPGRPKNSEAIIKDVKRVTRRQFNPEEKIAIVLEGLSGEQSIAEICRREGIAHSVYYSWSKAFLEAGKARLSGDTKREADSTEVSEMRNENAELKAVVAELTLRNRFLKSYRKAWNRPLRSVYALFKRRKRRDHPACGTI